VECHVSDGELRWSHPSEEAEPVTAAVLRKFANIRGAEDVEAFSRQHGVLKICTHGLPASHDPECHPARSEGWFREPVSAWLQLASEVRAIGEIAAVLHGGKPGNEDAWVALGGLEQVGRVSVEKIRSGVVTGDPETLYGIITCAQEIGSRKVTIEEAGVELTTWKSIYEFEPVTMATIRAQVAMERDYLARHVTRWLQNGGVSVGVSWTGPVPTQTMAARDLAGALAIRLAAQLTLVSLVPCNECGNWAKPPHKATDKAWCDECRSYGRPKAAATRARNARRAAGIPPDPHRGRNAIPRSEA
jgi:hypothetical protein